MEELTRYLGDVLQQAVDHDFKAPLRLAVVAANGNMVYIQYDESAASQGLTSTFLADHVPDRNFALPINILLVDSTGKSAVVLIKVEGLEYRWN